MLPHWRLQRKPYRVVTFDRTGDHTGHEAKSRSASLWAVNFRIQRIEPMTQKFIDQIATAQAVTLELKAGSEGAISGWASTYGGAADRHGDVILPGAFTKSLQRHKSTGESPVMLWAHMQEQPIGRWHTVREEAKGLYVEGTLNLRTEKGREAFEHVKGGDVGGLSIGYVTPEGGRKYAGDGVFHLSELDLFEVSIVAVPANPGARITSVKSLESKAEAIDMLRSCGLSRKAAAIFASGGWQALAGDDHHTKAIQLAAQMDAAIQRMRTSK
jgi:HK97 family phage prohead protease